MKKGFILGVSVLVVLLVISTFLALVLYEPRNTSATRYTYQIISTYPHDKNAFTEGLLFDRGFLYESTGLNGNSSLRLVDLDTGQVLQIKTLESQYFGEGIAVVDSRIVQLTWQSRIGFLYDKSTFNLLGNFTYATEGWGIAYDGRRLIMSDGTSTLYFLDPNTYDRIGQVSVHDGNVSITYLNELEYVNGQVYANIWGTQTIAIIDPNTGQVKAWIDLTGILNSTSQSLNNDLNGIAYDAEEGRLFVTGKFWPNLFEIRLVPKP